MKYLLLIMLITSSSLALECEEGQESYSFGGIWNRDGIVYCAYPEEVQEVNRQVNEEGLTPEEFYDYMDLRPKEKEEVKEEIQEGEEQ